jgi:alpha-galactosidase
MAPDVLLAHTYLDTSASPLGAALLRQPLLHVGVDADDLAALLAQAQPAGDKGRLRVSQPTGCDFTVAMEPEPAHRALVWQLDIAQQAGRPGPRLHDLCPLTLGLDGSLAPDSVIHTWLGGAMQSFFPPDAVTPQSRVLYPRTTAYYQPGQFTIGTRGGRSSDQHMPYVLITTSDDTGGLWCAIGWSGHWTARFVKPKGSRDLQLTVCVEPCDLRVPAGWRLRGPAVALGLYRGDLAAGCNALRRWLRSRMPALPGDGDLAHFNTWTAMDADVDEARLLDAADRVAGHGLRYFMLDAGWYPGPRDNFPRGVGNWRVDETKFPRGLEVVADRVRSHGMGMGLWIEPERAHLTSELAQQHPHWLLRVPDREHGLVNFALPEVRAYFRDTIGDLVRRLGLGWLKWDFNTDPLPYWQAADDGGLAHLGHVAGVWETFDWLRTTFPTLIVENCASGGNRLDWALFTRSLVNFANDQYTQPDCIRRIMGRMAAFLPTERLNMIFGPAQRRAYGDDAWQVLQGSAFGLSEPIDNWTATWLDDLRRHLVLHHVAAAARGGEFYRLTPDTPDLRAWEGWQMHDPTTGAGVVALWRSEASADSIVAALRGLDPAARYTVRDLYTEQSERLAGAALAQGLTVQLPPTGVALRAYQQERP